MTVDVDEAMAVKDITRAIEASTLVVDVQLDHDAEGSELSADAAALSACWFDVCGYRDLAERTLEALAQRAPDNRSVSVLTGSGESTDSSAPALESAVRQRHSMIDSAVQSCRVDVSLRLSGEREMQALNARFRQRDASTNVLSFPSGLPPLDERDVRHWAMGDIVICPDVVVREAYAAGRRIEEHLSHLFVHGLLHLCGHDHQSDEDAASMEALEIRILSSAGISDPYHGVAPDE